MYYIYYNIIFIKININLILLKLILFNIIK